MLLYLFAFIKYSYGCHLLSLWNGLACAFFSLLGKPRQYGVIKIVTVATAYGPRTEQDSF